MKQTVWEALAIVAIILLIFVALFLAGMGAGFVAEGYELVTEVGP